MLTREQAELELAVRNSARNHLLHFTKFTMKNFMINWHHKVQCDYLDAFERYEIKNLMIFTQPQVGKTELSTRRYSAYTLGRNPNKKVGVCAYNQTLASQFNQDIQKIIESNEYKRLFPETTLTNRSLNASTGDTYVKNSEKFDIVNHTGFLKSVGVGGPLTSTTLDLGIIDDPIKDDVEANSETYRDRLFEWYIKVFCSRFHNKSQQLITLTRWHEDDLVGRILEENPKDWTILKFPARKDVHEDDYDPREIGELLWPDRHDEERMSEIEEKRPKTWSSLYQQEPSNKLGEIFKKEDFEIVPLKSLYGTDFLKQRTNAVGDTAFKVTTKSDPSACISFRVFENDLYITDMFNEKLKFSQLIERFKKFMAKNGSNVSKLKIEPKASGISVVQHLKTTTSLNVSEYKMESGDKEERANAVEPYVSSGRVKLIEADWNATFIKQVSAFPYAKHDDIVDCLVMAINIGLVFKKKKTRRLKII